MVVRVVLGQYAPGDYRLRVSRPGYDASGTLPRAALAFDSSLGEVWGIHQVGSFFLSKTDTTNRVNQLLASWPSLGYVPAVLIFGYWVNNSLVPWGRNQRFATLHATDTGLYINGQANSGESSVKENLEYIVFANWAL